MLAIAVLLAIGMVVAGDYAVRLRTELGVDTCIPLSNTNSNCVQLNNEWVRRVGPLNYLFYALYVLPGLVASYVGGPLFAVEFERGTHRLAWTQSVSRARWVQLKLGVVLVVTLAAGVVLAPFGGGQQAFLLGSVMRPFETFEIQGLALVSYFAFGLAAGAFVGAFSRRLLTGMFVGLMLFAIVRVGVHNLRPDFQEPLTIPFAQSTVRFEPTAGPPPDAWMLGVRGFDLEGRRVPDDRVTALQRDYFSTPRTNQSDTAFLLEHGVIQRGVYQPADRFWTFQVIESAIFTGLAVLFAFLTLWRVRSRDA
jgi:hypothetical protein